MFLKSHCLSSEYEIFFFLLADSSKGPPHCCIPVSSSLRKAHTEVEQSDFLGMALLPLAPSKEYLCVYQQWLQSSRAGRSMPVITALGREVQVEVSLGWIANSFSPESDWSSSPAEKKELQHNWQHLLEKSCWNVNTPSACRQIMLK